jgi:hypothetical protein
VASYSLIEERAATAMHPACFVMQCTLMGKWFELVDGQMTKVEKGKVYQGIGINTRAAKFKAAATVRSEFNFEAFELDLSSSGSQQVARNDAWDAI